MMNSSHSSQVSNFAFHFIIFELNYMIFSNSYSLIRPITAYTYPRPRLGLPTGNHRPGASFQWQCTHVIGAWPSKLWAFTSRSHGWSQLLHCQPQLSCTVMTLVLVMHTLTCLPQEEFSVS